MCAVSFIVLISYTFNFLVVLFVLFASGGGGGVVVPGFLKYHILCKYSFKVKISLTVFRYRMCFGL